MRLDPSSIRRAALVAVVLPIVACAESAALPFDASVGPDPKLPPPEKSLIPTVNIAPARGWPDGAMPKAPAGFTVTAFAARLDHPRWLYVLPDGDVLVAETNAPPRPEDSSGVKGKVMKSVMAKAGAAVPSPNRITLLRDSRKAGVADTRTRFIEQLNSPFGMALVGDALYVANTDAVMRFPYREGQTRIDGAGTKVADLPAGPRNHHWTKNIVASRDGATLYATVGSNSNAAEHGLDEEQGRAQIVAIDAKTGTERPFATGLRNPNGMAFEPRTGALWTVVNERDELGSDLVPDYLTSVRDGGWYGWPWSYWGAHVDTRVTPAKPDRVAAAVKPDYALGNHVAPLGLAFLPPGRWPAPFDGGGAFIGEHGSWNRDPRSGYEVVFVPFTDGKPSGRPISVLTGFVSPSGEAWGRPVGVAIDARGGLLVADDVGNTVWRVAPAKQR